MFKIYSVTSFAILALLLGSTNKVSAQTTSELQFTYDDAGNQVLRKFVCVNCTTPLPQAFVSKFDGETGYPEDPKKTSKSTRIITGYPNPLTEILNLKWDSSDKYYITRIEVVSQMGLVVFKQEYGSAAAYQTQTSIPFQKQVPGSYLVRATYSDNKQVVIKVVKF